MEPLPGITVTLEEATPLTDYVTRKLRVEMVSENHTYLRRDHAYLKYDCSHTFNPFKTGNAAVMVSHFQYEGWPDTGVPASATSITDFVRHVHRGRGSAGPTLVMCSRHDSGGAEAIAILECVAEVWESMVDMGECPKHTVSLGRRMQGLI